MTILLSYSNLIIYEMPPLKWCCHVSSAERVIIYLSKARANNLTAPHIVRQRCKHCIFRIGKSRVLALESKQYIARRTFTMLGNYNLCFTSKIVSLFIFIQVIVLGTMYKKHHICVLFNGSRFAQVA